MLDLENRHIHFAYFYERIQTDFHPKYEEIRAALTKAISEPFDINVLIEKFMKRVQSIQEKQHMVLGSSVTAIAYKWGEDGTIAYGASRFTKMEKKEHFNKKAHRETATSRLEKWPIYIQLNPSQLKRRERESEIRRAIHQLGCGCRHF
jgi:hypothetical protein